MRAGLIIGFALVAGATTGVAALEVQSASGARYADILLEATGRCDGAGGPYNFPGSSLADAAGPAAASPNPPSSSENVARVLTHADAHNGRRCAERPRTGPAPVLTHHGPASAIDPDEIRRFDAASGRRSPAAIGGPRHAGSLAAAAPQRGGDPDAGADRWRGVYLGSENFELSGGAATATAAPAVIDVRADGSSPAVVTAAALPASIVAAIGRQHRTAPIAEVSAAQRGEIVPKDSASDDEATRAVAVERRALVAAAALPEPVQVGTPDGDVAALVRGGERRGTAGPWRAGRDIPAHAAALDVLADGLLDEHVLAQSLTAPRYARRGTSRTVAVAADARQSDSAAAVTVEPYADAYAADLAVELARVGKAPDPDLRSLVIVRSGPNHAWLEPGLLASSLPVPSDADAMRYRAEVASVALGRFFSDGVPDLSVPGAGIASPRSADTIAVARAAEGRGTFGGNVALAVRLAVAGRDGQHRAPSATGGAARLFASASSEPAGSDGGRSDDMIIMPAAQSLLGGDLRVGAASPAVIAGSVHSLRGAVALALETNPEIGQAVANREATAFELAQGRGGYLPRLDVEARAGVQVIDSATTRFNDDEDHVFAPVEGRVTLTQMLFDGFATDAEVERQASRVDGAAYRIQERAEFIALDVVRAHQDVNRLVEILALAQENLAFHRRIRDDLARGAQAGAISIADRQQAEERIIAAEVFISQSREQLEAARITFNRLVGQFPATTQLAPSVAGHLPSSLDHAVGAARANNPIVRIADAAISTAYAERKAAYSEYWPLVDLELIGRAGENLDGVRGRDAEARAMLVMSWNLYQGGVKPARVQERVRRIDEQWQKLFLAQREAEETMRTSWDRWEKQRQRLGYLRKQLEESTLLLASYQEQFSIGERSLLDVLDTQDTRFAVQVAVVTARHAERFAEYRILASAGMLLATLGIEPPAAAIADARAGAGVPPVPGTEQRGERQGD